MEVKRWQRRFYLALLATTLLILILLANSMIPYLIPKQSKDDSDLVENHPTYLENKFLLATQEKEMKPSKDMGRESIPEPPSILETSAALNDKKVEARPNDEELLKTIHEMTKDLQSFYTMREQYKAKLNQAGEELTKTKALLKKTEEINAAYGKRIADMEALLKTDLLATPKVTSLSANKDLVQNTPPDNVHNTRNPNLTKNEANSALNSLSKENIPELLRKDKNQASGRKESPIKSWRVIGFSGTSTVIKTPSNIYTLKVGNSAEGVKITKIDIESGIVDTSLGRLFYARR